MDKLSLFRVSEVTFLTKLQVEFCNMIGMEDLPSEPKCINFADLGERLFGFCSETPSFIDGYGGYTKAVLHVAFEVPNDMR
jgi:hypothetical protein